MGTNKILSTVLTLCLLISPNETDLENYEPAELERIIRPVFKSGALIFLEMSQVYRMK